MQPSSRIGYRPPAMSDVAIATHGLSKRYGEIHAVEGLTVEIPHGVIAGFVGPNGSGKTTTIRMLLGQVRPTAGSAEILGISIGRPRDVLRNVGALIESPTFYPGLSGRDNLRVLARLGGIPYGRVDAMLELVGLRDRAMQRISGYSLGMRQRLGVAAALLPDPRLLVLDEPANGLDPEGIQEIRALLRRLRDEGKTVFISSHLLGELEQVADWLVAIRSGTLLYAGRTGDMLARQSGELVVRPEKDADVQTVLKIAQSLGGQAEISDAEVHIKDGEGLAAELNRKAMDAGVTLVSIRAVKATLEESFLTMVAGDN